MNIQGYIYKLTLNRDLDDFKKGEIYIGKHNGRKLSYFSGGKLIKRITDKYGNNVFDREIICKDISTNELLCYMEIYYIEYYQCNRNKYNKNLNLTEGGEGIFGYKRTKQHCENLSKTIKEQYKQGLRKIYKEKDLHQYNIDTGVYIKTFKNCTEAALSIGQPAKSNTAIASAARDKHASAYGFMWSYKKMEIIDKIAGSYKPIIKYDLQGNFIEEYKNCTVATNQNNIKNNSSISNCASGLTKTAYGFIWRFKDSKIPIKLYSDYKNISNNKRRSKLSEEDVLSIRESLKSNKWGVMSDLSKKYNVSTSVIQNIKTRKTWNF